MAEDLENKIIEKASELYIRLGIKAVSMDMISQEVGISKRTLYEVFTSKNELTSQCLQMMATERQRRIKEIWDSKGDLIERIVAIIEDNINSLRGVNPLFFTELLRMFPGGMDNFIKNKPEEEFAAFLREGIDSGYIRKDIDIQVITQLLRGNRILETRTLLRQEPDFDRVYRDVSLVIFRGICTIKGIERFEELMKEKKL